MIKTIIKSEFFRASFWVFLATGVLNAGNYLFHLLMGRMLGPEGYGVLESVISFYYLVSIPFVPLTLIIVKFISSYKGKHDRESMYSFYHYIKRKIILYGSIGTFFLLIVSPLIMSFLHLPDLYFPLLLTAGFFIGLFAVLIKGTLQGLFNFFGLFIANTLEIVTKLIVAIFLVYIGFKALGAFFALIASFIIGLLAAFYFVRKEKFSAGKNFEDGKEIFKYSIPVFLTSLGFTSLFSADILLVRNLFSGVESGLYAALSVLGKIIFFGTSPVTMVLFPMASERHAASKGYKNILVISIALTMLISIIILAFYFILPETMVSLLFGEKFMSIAPLLSIFGIFIAIYSLSSLLANFYLSIQKTRISILVFLASIIQVILIFIFHESLLQVIYMSIISTSLLLLSLIAYFPFAKIEKK